jgi:DNA-binding CsgD family transcriptional regulator/tetratricopeptide (TPR) repeat protein
MELLERERFFNELEGLLAAVAAGPGRLVLVGGEAGIGKTSLVERFAETHQSKARVLWGACDALLTPRPLGPLYDIAQQTQGRLLALLEEEAPRAPIFSAVLDEIKSGGRPSIAVIEDVHWADEATLDLLKFLGRRISRTNCLLVVTYRDDEVGAEHPLRLVLGDLPSRLVVRMGLPPLSEDGVKRLEDLAGRRIQDLYQVTGGNPFFVTEALESRAPGVPVTVRDAVLSRAARLSPAARAVLELMSVVPARTETWLLDDAIGPEAGALVECVGAGMLRSDGDAVAFRHELARRAVEDSLHAARRQSLHNLILDALVNRGSESLLARIVHHAAHGGNRAAVLKYAPVAARQASALAAHRESASHYQAALGHADALEPGQRAGLFECWSYECYLTGQIEEALQARRAALELWQRLGDARRQGENLRWMSRMSWGLARKKEAEGYGIEAVTILEGLPPGPELAMAYSNRAQLHMLADEHDEAVLWGSRAIALAERLGATDTLVHALNNVGMAELLAGNDQGRRKLEESLRLALANDLQDHAGRAYTNLATAALRARDYPLALRHFEAGIAYTTQHDLDFYSLYMTTWRGRARFEQGDWDGAADDAGFVLGRHRVWPTMKICTLAVLGHVGVRRGDSAAALRLDEAHALAAGTGELQRVAPVAAARAEAAWLAGDVEGVKREARLVFQMAKGHDDPWIRGEFSFWLWRAGGAPVTDQTIAAPYALQMRGDWRAAAAAWSEIGCPYEAAVALADGDEAARRAALGIFERLGAGPAAERLRLVLRASGARGIPRGPRASTRGNAAGLTNRQLEVLALMADGLSNHEIGGRLFISPKTVDHHVGAVLAKLDAGTRAQAASIAIHAGLIKKKAGAADE